MYMKKFDYKDINLVPKKCIVDSRSECDTSLKLGNFTFKMPIVPSNMESVINEDLCIKLAEAGHFYIMHRFDNDMFEFHKMMKSRLLVSSISMGVNEDAYQLVDKFVDNDTYPDFITIDIAHGHSVKMKDMIKYIKANLPGSFIIAGNVSTPEGVSDLESWGAHATKVGIAPGAFCSTAMNTGFGSRGCQASVIKECATVATKPIIADGGIREPGDIAKSLVLGATCVMIGGMLGGFLDSPGETIYTTEGSFKEMWGSASNRQSGKTSRIEGISKRVPLKNKTFLEEYKFLTECLQSSISYGGGKDLKCFLNVYYI